MIQVYLQDNDELYKLSKSEANILFTLWKVCAENKIVINQQIRDFIKQMTDLGESTIKNGIASLTKKQMLIKDPNYKGIYYLNPKYFKIN